MLLHIKNSSQTVLHGALGIRETNLGVPEAHLNLVHILLFVKFFQVTFKLYNVCILAVN